MSSASAGVLIVFLCFASSAAAPLRLRSAPSGSSLSPNASAALRNVEQGVKALRVPKSAAPPKVQQAGPASSCSFLGGLLTAHVSQQCCNNIQVVTQRQLDDYGMAQACKPDWKCEGDGVTPLSTFETTALSGLCGEPGCVPALTAAFQANTLTSSSAAEMSNICNTLSSLGGSNADPEAVSDLLTGAESRQGKGSVGRAGKRSRKEDKKKEEEEDTKKRNEKDKKKKKEESSCFPGEAVVTVQDRGTVPVAELRVGDRVLASVSDGKLAYESVLSFLHVQQSTEPLDSFTVTHERGSFRASPAHIVFVAEAGSWSSKMVGRLQEEEHVFVAGEPGSQWDSTPSRILSIKRSSSRTGMYAPLTSSGTIVVDNVVASNYASPSMHKSLPHSIAHLFLLPVRIYHKLGLAFFFQPVWERLCSASDTTKNWYCHGNRANMPAESEELHPYLKVMWHGLKIDRLLNSY